MNREPEQYGGKCEEQTRIADAGLERMQGFDPVIGGPATEQSAVVSERAPAPAPIPTADATVSFGGKDRVSSGWIPEIPYDSAHRAMAGGVGSENFPSTPPDHFGHPLTPVPNIQESASGRAFNSMEEILRHGRGK